MNYQNLYYEPFPKDITDDSDVESEPITLQELKDYMMIEGFVDEDESTTDSLSDYSLDDTYMTALIKSVRKYIEKSCGISLVFHTWKDLIKNEAGDIEIRMGPIRSVTSVLDSNDDEFDEEVITTRGFDFQILEAPTEDKMIITYTAGYEDVPEDLLDAIKMIATYWYNNKGTDIERKRAIPNEAAAILANYRRPWIYLG